MKHLVVGLTEPVEGREDEYNDYYENLHLDEVLESTGWSSAQRFELTDEVGKKCPLPYLAFYEAEAEDPKDILKTLDESRPQRVQSDSLNRATAGVWIFSPTGPRHEPKS